MIDGRYGPQSDVLFSIWEKFKENPVIKSTEWGITNLKDPSGKNTFVGSADPSNIWKKNGKYYLLTGNLLVLRKFGSKGIGLPANKDENVLPKDSISYQGDRLYLFESENLVDWNYLKEFYNSNFSTFDDPFITLHNRSEGTLEFTNLLFVPTQAPFDLFEPERKTNINLYISFFSDSRDLR